MRTKFILRAALLTVLLLSLAGASKHLRADTGTCGGGAPTTLPFTDVSSTNFFFCAIAEAYFSGLTNGTTATTYSPGDVVDRQQMAAFMTRTLDQSLRRGSRRAALNQFWTTTPHYDIGLATTQVGDGPALLQSDGSDLWVPNGSSGTVSRVRASDGRLLETWTGATGAQAVLVAMGRVFIIGGTGNQNPGRLFAIDPSQPPGSVVTVASDLAPGPFRIAFDGNRIWSLSTDDVSITTPAAATPWSSVIVHADFGGYSGIVYDGTNIWVSEVDSSSIKRLDQNGNAMGTVVVGDFPESLVFDGTNIWVGHAGSNSVISVIRASTATPIAGLLGNGVNNPWSGAFDGQRIMFANNSGNSVSMWRASDLTPLGSFPTGSPPFGVCSDGINFWITLPFAGKVARF